MCLIICQAFKIISHIIKYVIVQISDMGSVRMGTATAPCMTPQTGHILVTSLHIFYIKHRGHL